MNTIAKKLTLDEIKALPKASIIWMEVNDKTDNGIVWYSLDPVMIRVPGENGYLIGGNKDSIIDLAIDSHLLDNISIWNHEPNREQLTGITQEEYDSITDEESIVLSGLSAAITSRRYTFKSFCELAGLNYADFMDALTGKREFIQMEMVVIRSILNMSDAETMAVFFPDFR